MTRVCVVGGGSSGLSAAVHAAGCGAGVVLLERNRECGLKLLATGGGRANVSNLRSADEWARLFGRRGRFILPALAFLPLEKLCDWFTELGVPLSSPDGFHLFPVVNSARTVRDAFVAKTLRLGVELRTGCRAERLCLRDGRLVGVNLADGTTVDCDAAVIASGGRSWPATGSTGEGYALSAQAGHRATPTYPGLVGLRIDNLSSELAGLVLPNAKVTCKLPGRKALVGDRELLLTHGGVSGPAILDLSGEVVEALAVEGRRTLTAHIAWQAQMRKDDWLAKLDEWRRKRGGDGVLKLVREHLPNRLARWLCGWAGVDDDMTAANLPARLRDRLAVALGAFPAEITGSEGWDKAMITRGGIDLREVDPKTLASRLVAGLYFSGELLDIDGPCGGYNLHWAFASGALAGSAAAKCER